MALLQIDPAKLLTIVGTLLADAQGFKTPNTVENIFTDLGLMFSAAQVVDPAATQSTVAQEFEQVITQAPASLANLKNGQPAIGPTVTISLDGIPQKVATFGVLEDSAWAKTNLGL